MARGVQLGLSLITVAFPILWSGTAVAQDEATTTVVFVPEDGTTATQSTIVTIGVRQGVRDVEGVRFVHPVDQLTELEYSEDFEMALAELDSLADMIRTGDARRAYQRADELIRVFEANLLRIRRAQLVDAYMLSAIGRCQAGRARECTARMREVLAFREGLEYDVERYGEESRDVFDRARLSVTNGHRGDLVVETDPPGAEIYIDGQSYGPSPIRAEALLEGGHYVTIKEVGHLKQIIRAEVQGNRDNVSSITLTPNPGAELIGSERVQDGLRAELGEQRAGDFIRRLGSSLRTRQVIVGVLRPDGGRVQVHLYLYHMTTYLLQAEQEVTLSVDEAGVAEVAAATTRLYEGVDLHGGIEAPDDPDDPLIAGPQPEFYEQWWFWVAAVGGAVVVASAIAAGATIADQSSGPPAGVLRFDFGRLP